MNGWIWAEDGALVNMAHVMTIRVRRGEHKQYAPITYEVVAALAGGGSVRLTRGSKSDCEQYVNHLAEQLAERVGVPV